MLLAWTTRARKEPWAAIERIARNAPEAALRQLLSIERQTDMLLRFPELGRPGAIPGTRELVISRSPFIVLYQIKAGEIEILRFLHTARLRPK
ncbi:type II toxin-antitoxin system RelE/ParE family toxin [Pseudoduganella violacea]|uniref:Toxin ParE1/3/4 n=1 Tax=Pseudoduganella violacea TaxID=1715466 RepID=A0A7W5B8J0_9BURK|nr:type II toxin-antitoxin system RelE/ParE family toxin [Pseudoduganella violacea]MBB3118501.1 toxin ParE1/3/4 [Pseudoduganella violacea]